MQSSTAARRGGSPHDASSEEPGDGDAGMGRYVHTTDKSDPRWRLRRFQQQASLSLLPASSDGPTSGGSSELLQDEGGDDGATVVDEAWVRCVGRLGEGQLLEAVTHLELQAVDAPCLVGMECLGELLPGLESLAFSLGSRLPSLRDLGTAIGRTLRFLDVTACGLEGLEGAAALPLLRELHASHNRIRDMGPLCLHDHLEVLDVEGNPLRRLAGVDLLASLPRLHTLTLRGTPLRDALVRAAEEDGREEAAAVRPYSSSGEGEPHYRALVAAVLPGLLLLDGRRLLLPSAAASTDAPVVPVGLVERAHAALRREEEQEEKEERQQGQRDGREGRWR